MTKLDVVGCSSNILTVKVVSTIPATKDTTVCANQLPFQWNGMTVDKADDYVFKTKSAAGCDSTITLTVKVNQPTSSTTTINICSNQLQYSWNGKSYTSAGTYTYITKNRSGCDS